jgi:hypothetical protein
MDQPTALALIVGFVACGIAGGMMLERIKRGGTGFTLGFFLGPIGLVIAWIMRDNATREIALHSRQIDAPAARLFGSDLDSLERLAKLKDAGHITPEEFELKKQELLAPKPTSPSP